MLIELLTNKIFLTIILAGLGVQVLKAVLLWLETKKFHWKDLIVTGGMPSSHASWVVSLVTIIYLTEGLTSSLFIALVVAAIVIRDAFGVRRTVGEEGLLLNKISKHLKINNKLHYSMGHTPLQVLVGSILGFVIALIIHFM